MADEDLLRDLDELIEWTNREHQGYWRSPPMCRPINERLSVEELFISLEVEDADVKSSADDPPDCVVTHNGVRIGVEVTDLIEGEAIRRTKHCLKRLSPEDRNDIRRRAQNTFYRHWTKRGFLDSVQERIRVKDADAKRWCSAFAHTWLLIRTDEFELAEHNVGEFLRGSSFFAASLERAFFILPPKPSLNGERELPCFELPIHRGQS